ncbi:MAG: hypothetical protein AB7O28_17840 [Vicinamibacterales bacterium]
MPAAGEGRRGVLASRIGTIALGTAVSWQLVQATLPYAYLSAHALSTDDAFYYFQIVRNYVRLGWFTFDGLHAASGVQLLWSFLLVPLAWAVEDRDLFMRAVMVVCAALNLATGLGLRRLTTRLHSETAGEWAAALWAMVLLVRLTPSLTGMEYSLHTTVVVLTLLAWWPIVARPAAATLAGVAGLACLLVVNFWTRLDSALYSGALGAVAAWRLWSAGALSRPALAWLAGAPLAGGLAYMTACLAIGGTAVPISGLVKQMYAARYFDGQPASTVWRERVEWWIQIQVQPIVDVVATPLGIAAWQPSVKVACFLVGVALAGWGLWRAWQTWHHARTRAVAIVVGSVLLIGGVHVAVLIASIAHFSYVTRHYYAWNHVAWAIFFAYVGAEAAARWPRLLTRPVAAAALAVVAAAQGAAVAPRFQPVSTASLKQGRFVALQWVRAHLPPGKPIAAWNAGQVGYFLDRPVVNLDGLVNDRRFAEALRERRPLVEYLRAEGIDYVMDYDAPDLSMPYHASWNHAETFRNALSWDDVTVIHEQPAGSGTIHVLQVKPRAVSAGVRGGDGQGG